ncbi:MAG: hypothetical protein JKY37_01610 [Nannocystaceae bacterium]|nr:hypothetical protein [Nannocystaceae bacterium]
MAATVWMLLFVSLAVMAQRVRPAWNLDGVFYSGVSHQQTLKESTDAQVHAQVYREVDEAVPPGARSELLESSDYRRRVALGPADFASQLPFYSVKRAYVVAVGLIRRTGQSGIEAAHTVSRISYVLLCIVVSVGLHNWVSRPILAPAAGLALVFAAPMVSTAELASPDLLCALILISALFCCLSRRFWSLGCLLCGLSVLCRPDAVLFAAIGVLLPSMLASSRRRRIQLAGFGGAALVSGSMPLFFGDGYGWTMAMRQTFFGATTDIDRLREGGLSWNEYVTALDLGLKGQMATDTGGYWVYLLVLGLASAATFGTRMRSDRRARMVIFASSAMWVAAVVHVVVFPLIADRILLPAYVASVVAAVVVVDRVLQGLERSHQGVR